ncbi:MAG TPA: cupin domain-containing protein [Steroidobacteraceae bacterium]
MSKYLASSADPQYSILCSGWLTMYSRKLSKEEAMLKSVLATLFIVLGAAPALARTAEDELRRLAEDYARDPSLDRAVTFGIRIDEQMWTIVAKPATESEAASVVVERGAPTVPAFVYETDSKTFARIVAGEIHALTTMAQARSSDPAPMRVDTVNGFQMDEAGRAAFLSVSFHFFTTGIPEIVPLGPSRARPVHGGEALPIYYAKGLRTSWYAIAPGQHINAEAEDQVNDFPSLFIILEAGSARGRIGGREMVLGDNQAIFVPAGMSHEFWNPGNERATLLLIMFGENA